MNLISGSDSFRYFKIISVNNKKINDKGRYKTKGSPGDAAKKAFTQLSKKYKTNKLTFSIKETTQGSTKKEHGPYLGEKNKLKKPLTVKYKGKNGINKPVIIKFKTKIHLVKDRKQKGGMIREVDGGGGCGHGEEKIIFVFLLDTHHDTPEQLREILLSRPNIKNIAYFQEHYMGPISGSQPRKDRYYDWQETKKIPGDKNVLIFPCGPPSGTYDMESGNKLYMSSFLKLLNDTNLMLETYDAFIISTGHSYPIATTLLPPYKYTKSIKIYDLHPFQLIDIRERHKQFKDTIYNHEPFEINNLLETIKINKLLK